MALCLQDGEVRGGLSEILLWFGPRPGKLPLLRSYESIALRRETDEFGNGKSDPLLNNGFNDIQVIVKVNNR